jgi:hypothetical protein
MHTFLDCYSVFSPLHAYFLPTHGNEEVPVLGKFPYRLQECPLSHGVQCMAFNSPVTLAVIMFPTNLGLKRGTYFIEEDIAAINCNFSQHRITDGYR